MPKSAVIDTSVLVSAFLFRESVPGRVLELAEQNVYTLYLSPILMEEVTRSLHHPRLTSPSAPEKGLWVCGRGCASLVSHFEENWDGVEKGIAEHWVCVS